MNNLKKIIAIATIVSSLLMTAGPTFGATAEELAASIAALQAQLTALTAQLAALQGTTPTVTGCTITSFARNLSQGMTGDDVKCLQVILNSDAATKVAATGAGSPGAETTYFGALTKAAVVKFQEKYAADCLTPLGLTAGTGFVGTKTRAKLNTMLGVIIPPTACTTAADCPAGYNCTTGACVLIPVAGGLTVALSAVTPAASTIIAYDGTNSTYQAQVLAPFITVNFTAGSNGDVKVTNLKFTRTGIAADANLETTYLYEGNTKLTEGGSISSKVVTFNNASGIFTVPAGTTKAITLKGDLDSAVAAGKTIGFNLTAVADVTSNAAAVSGVFPITGNLMTVANATDLGYVLIDGSYKTPVPPDTAVSPQDDYTVWSFSLKANEQNLNVERLVFTEVGSISADDLENFKLYYGGTVVGTATGMNADHQVIFDLSASPISILKGATKVLTLHADIVKGSTKTFAFTFQYATDLLVKDTNYGVYVPSAVAIANWTLVQPTGNYKISSGTLSATKRTDSPTGDVSLDATGVLLAKYDFKAAGEDIKVSSLRIAADTTRTGATPSTPNGLDNGMVYFNGVQVGSTKDITEYASGAVGEGTSFTFGSSFIVPAGTTGLVEIKADVKSIASASFVAGNTVRIYLLNDVTAPYNNAQGVSSLTILNVPSTAADSPANILTVRAGSLTFTKNAAYGNQNTTAPSTGFLMGSFQMLAGSTEGVNVDSITVAIEDTTATAKLENLMLMIGTEQIGSTKVTPGVTNTFSVNVTLAASQAKTVNVFADILSTAGAGVAIDADGFEITGTGTTALTSTAAIPTGICYLQVITVAPSNLAVSYDTGNISDSLVVGLTSGVQMAKYKFSSTYEAFTVSEFRVYASSEQDRTAPRYNKSNIPDFLNIWLSYKDSTGATVTTSKRSTFVNGMIDFAGLDIYVPANGTASVTIYADLNVLAPAGYALTGDRPQISLAYYKANSGSISSLERRTGIIVYPEVGTPDIALTWFAPNAVVHTGDTYANDLLFMEGANVIKFTAAASFAGGYHGGELDIPVRDLDLKPSEIVSLQFSVQTDDNHLVGTGHGGPGISLFVDCDLDGAFDGEIMYVNYPVTAINTWETEEMTQASLVDWWSQGAPVCGANGTNVALSTFPDTDAKIIGIGFSHGYYAQYVSVNHKYYADKLILNTAIATYAVEDDMGELGTNYVLYKTKPVVTRVGASTETSLTNGTQDLYKFNIAADNGGDVALKGIVFSITGSDALTLNTLKLYKGSVDYTTAVVIGDDYAGTHSYESTGTDLADVDGGDASGPAFSVYVVFTDEEIIGAGTSQNFTLKGLVAGAVVGTSITTYIQQDLYPSDKTSAKDIGTLSDYATVIAASVGSQNHFVWSDKSWGDAAHSLLSLDWVNGFLVDTLGDGLSYTVSK